MGVTVLPDQGPAFAQALAGIGSGLSKAINPSQDIQKQFQQAILANPEIGRQLAQVEREQPGTIDRLLGLNRSKPTKLYQTIAGMQPSSDIMLESIKRGAISGISPEELGVMNKEWISKVMTGMNQGQAAQSGAIAAGTKTAQASNPNFNQDAANVATLGDVGEVVDLKKKDAGLKGQNILNATRFISKQNIDEQEKLGAFAAIPGALDEHQFHERLAFDKELFNLKEAKDIAKADDRSKDSEADDWVKITSTGNREGWKKYLFGDPADRKNMKELDDAFHSVSVDKLAVKNSRLNTIIATGIKAINAVDKNGSLIVKDPSERQYKIKILEEFINQKAALGSPRVKVVDEPPASFAGFSFGHNKLKFVDEKTGKEVPEEELTADYQLPPGFTNGKKQFDMSKLSSNARQAYNRLKGADDQAAAIDSMKVQAPTLYKELQSAGAF